MTSKLKLAAAISLTVGGASATQAATTTLYLVAVREHLKGTYSNGNIASSTATWSYDDVSGLLTQSGGEFNVRFTTVPTTTLYRYTSTGLSVGAGGSASATTFSCLDGNFGSGAGASICGNYNFGANFVNDSSLTYSGSSVTRTLGGDDTDIGPPRGISVLDNFQTISWDGSSLVIGNPTCSTSSWPGYCPAPGPYPNGYNRGYSFVLQTTVPLPAAVWLFGGALGALGIVKRRARA